MRTGWIRVAAVLSGLLALLPLDLFADTEEDWSRLEREVTIRQDALRVLIREADQAGIPTDYATVSDQVLAAFRRAARHDWENSSRVRRIFQTFSHIDKTDPAETELVALRELEACLAVADFAVTELRSQMAGDLHLRAPPDVSASPLILDGGYYRFPGGRIVFPSSLVWMPKEEAYLRAFGRLGEAYYHLGNLQEDGRVGRRTLDGLTASLSNQRDVGASPLVLFLGHAPAGWMKRRHPEILEGARHFTPYDIDSPLIREWISSLCAEVLPALGRATDGTPMVHLLANEPHFATQRGGWDAGNGLSAFGIGKYRAWLANRHETIDALNDAYGASYSSFGEVTIALPVDPGLRGGAVWYDWCRFNMDRVNDWFVFLKDRAQAQDGRRAPVTIKMLGFTLSTPLRDHGLDIEFLTRLQDVPGGDLRVVPWDAQFFGKQEEGLDPDTGWRARYAYDWVEQSMYLDFTKSLCPEKLFYDSEWHGFGAVRWRHFRLERAYVRSALWLAFSHGMGAIKPWLWGRDVAGALKSNADHIGELSTQPVALDAYGRTMKELNAHADRVGGLVPRLRRFLLFYCEEAAIQDARYTAGMKDVFEALKLLNLSVGFTTPSDIARLDGTCQTLVIPPTRFISEGALVGIRAFQEAGGRVVLVGGDGNFGRDEWGRPRTGDRIRSPFATLPATGVAAMVDDLEPVLASLTPAPPITAVVTHPDGSPARGVLIQQSTDPDTGRPLVLLNNVSKGPRVVRLSPGGGVPPYRDVLTGVPQPARVELASRSVRLLIVDL